MIIIGISDEKAVVCINMGYETAVGLQKGLESCVFDLLVLKYKELGI